MSLRWSAQEFEDWRLRKGAHGEEVRQERGVAKAVQMIEARTGQASKLAGSRRIGPHKAHRGMNKLEAAFAQTLEYRKQAGELVWWEFEPFRIRLANGSFYRPDFVAVDTAMRTEIYECKGHFREAARVRLKVAVEKLPYPFYLVRKHKGELRVTPV
jgi:hypothetical protein